MAHPEIGRPAPEFTLPSTAPDGITSLSSLRGTKVVLAYYVFDFTGG